MTWKFNGLKWHIRYFAGCCNVWASSSVQFFELAVVEEDGVKKVKFWQVWHCVIFGLFCSRHFIEENDVCTTKETNDMDIIMMSKMMFSELGM